MAQNDEDDEDVTNEDESLVAETTLPAPAPTALFWRLYISHALSAWGDRMWAFAVALFFIEIWPDSILLVAIYGLACDLATGLLGAHAGDFVDRTPRLRAVFWAIIGQNCCIFVCVGSIILVLWKGSDLHDGLFWFLVVSAILSGSLSEVANMAGSIAVEKDWVRVIAGNDSKQLAKTNAILRRIDLTCNLLGPLATGLIMSMSTSGILVGALVVAGWNIVTLVPEYMLLSWVYRSFPALAVKKVKEQAVEQTTLQKIFKQVIVLRSGWKTFASQSVAPAGVALALLYCTVLSFGSVMTAYVYARGVSEATLAGLRGAGAVFGVVATFFFAPLHNKFGLVKTGTLSIWFQWSSLLLCIVSFLYIGDSSNCSPPTAGNHSQCITARNTEIALLSAGVVVSRVGLWLFDLAVSQQLQERVDPSIIGIVNGVEGSLCTLFDMLIYILSIGLSHISQFKYLVIVSVGTVFVAAVMYTRYAVSGNATSHQPLQAVETEEDLQLESLDTDRTEFDSDRSDPE
eukprot:m.160204 g.160204  ORF g.160204 m.160204 type:complete len:516 (-) comp53025_c0_seq1:3569-5116(-)